MDPRGESVLGASTVSAVRVACSYTDLAQQTEMQEAMGLTLAGRIGLAAAQSGELDASLLQ